MAGVQGRVALVTGAGSAGGIGFACARLLKAAGAKVAITSTTGASSSGRRTGRWHVRARGRPGGDGPVDALVNGGGGAWAPSTSWSTMPAWCRRARRAVKAGAGHTRRAVAARHGHQHHHGVQGDEARGARHDGAALWPHRQHELGDGAAGVEPQGHDLFRRQGRHHGHDAGTGDRTGGVQHHGQRHRRRAGSRRRRPGPRRSLPASRRPSGGPARRTRSATWRCSWPVRRPAS